MILVADSGSTKTGWCFVSESGARTYFHSIGMNPYNISNEQLSDEMTQVVIPALKGKTIKALHFYGSGCSADAKKHFMNLAMREFFPKAFIEIEHDLLGACRALCGTQAGIAAILGTGSNSCLFDGKDILENVPSLGYVMCDEGAGSQIGKILLREYLRNEFPKELHDEFHKQFPQNENEFLDILYKKPLPNRFLASFAPFAQQYKGHPYMQSLLDEIFSSFFKRQIMKYTNYQKQATGIVGSIGFFFEDVIRKTAKKYDIEIGKIVKEPLDSLVSYHLEN